MKKKKLSNWQKQAIQTIKNGRMPQRLNRKGVWHGTGKPIERKNGESGYIYLIKDINSNIYKIGKTGNFKKRLQQHKSSNPNIISVYFARVNNMDKCEKVILRAYNNLKISGEWFNFTDEHINSIKKFIDKNSPDMFPPQMKIFSK